ncbi:MAG: ATP-binding protein [Spirochaetota bacterium]
MRGSLFARVLGAYVAAVLLGLFVLGLVTHAVLRSHTRRDAFESTIELAELLASAADSGEMPLLSSETATVALLAQDGAVVAGGPLPATLEDSLARTRSAAPTAGLADDAPRTLVYAIAPLPSNAFESDPDEHRYLVLSRRADVLRGRTYGPTVLIISAAAAFMLVLGGLINRFLRSINDPVVAIQGAARRYAAGELEVHLRTHGPPELQSLAEDLNEMARQLRTRIAAINAQRNQLEAILSSMLEGVVVLDDERRIISLNEAAGRLLQVSPGESRGRTLLEHLRNAQLDELAELALEREQPVERSVTLYRERPVHLQIHATPLRSEFAARPTGSLLVLNDITRLKHLEELRKDFVANVSHELKTPITSIKGFVETLIDDGGSDPQTSERFLRIILNHTNRLHLIVEDLLSLSRLEQNNQRIEFDTFTVHELIASAVEICSGRAREKAMTIETTTAGEPTARGNVHLLEQALVNLIDNAVKYSPSETRVVVEGRNEPGRLVLLVTDSGPGIRDQDVPRIFERFYRTDRARSREMGGTGLGLAIVKHIARAHGGDVAVETRLGEGSTFTITIPRARSGEQADDDLGPPNDAPE